MKNKRVLLIVLGIALAAVLIGILFVGMRVAPTVNHALRISELLQPVLDAPNQMMRIAVSAKINAKPLEIQRDVFLITEDGTNYIALEQKGTAVFVSENMLFLENGKAFKIGDEVRLPPYQDLLPQIGILYDALKITAEETETETIYSITVSGEEVKTLLAATTLPVEGIDKLDLRLTEKNGKLAQIQFAGSGVLDDTEIALEVILSDFRILAAGDYPIPETVKQCTTTVDPNELFSLSEDLYRLVLALAPLAEMERIDGSLELRVDCGLIQLDKVIKLSELPASTSGQIDPEQLKALPEMIGLLCMEGDIDCTQKGDTYAYTLKLDKTAMGQLSRMILPELAQYGENLTAGSVTILLESGDIRSINVAIEGKISARIAQIPITAAAVFTFE